MIEIDGKTLDLNHIAAVARGGVQIAIAPSARVRMQESQRAAAATASARPFYGRSTGVGANRSIPLDQTAESTKNHGLNLLRSHAVDAGRTLEPEVVRAMLVVRLSQLAAGYSGIDPGVADALVAMINADSLPEVREFGGIGTGDLPALAGTALTLMGERKTANCSEIPSLIESWAVENALPFLSSNALTIGQATLAYLKLATVFENLRSVSALSFVALSGNPEAFSEEVGRAADSVEITEAARSLRALVEGHGRPARIQDPYCLRTLPLVIGSVSEDLNALKATLEHLVVAGQENPLVYGSVADGTNDVAHHGLFEMTILTKRVDAVQLALGAACATVIRRISLLCDPEYTNLNRFLAGDDKGQSGVMMLEFVAAAAAATIRAGAPASQQTIAVSLGAEDDASFAPVATSRLESTIRAMTTLVAIEFICSSRALRLQDRSPEEFTNPTFRKMLEAGFSLPAAFQDRDLRPDIDAASRLVLSPVKHLVPAHSAATTAVSVSAHQNRPSVARFLS
ncbi:histidine ammonia-lyase HutH [Arthrobacter sp. 24S4-2]|uniref:aromatic amino acid ammonia-lyase n=1 Tax=Arthrobacter sp. 24S4-2 TaxID=2575374 RepID=UPI0010C79432|nr:aromatic amino acid ammonia-lyase [Arthrobacter sp. 24S4-2]QCO98420.1 histidine ammonia-lyase HutH [Arthrobacter sp. 24S4-2]